MGNEKVSAGASAGATDYRSAGVNREEGYRTVSMIKKSCERTRKEDDGVLSGPGGFGSLYALGSYRQPVLVSGTDGVGTKLDIAIFLDRLEGIGIDCVAMCVNDILCNGARPLFFLDYLASGKLKAERMARLVEGVADGCVTAGCALVGGETAEMPGIYKSGDFDIAGFAVGAVEQEDLIDGSRVEKGDLIIGLDSSGPHANGFSLIRKLTEKERKKHYTLPVGGTPLADLLLEPTRIYVPQVLPLCEEKAVKSIAHITGGGFYENIPRAIPDHLAAQIEKKLLPSLPLFEYLSAKGVAEEEMYRTFNMGIGMVLVVSPALAETVKAELEGAGVGARTIGRIADADEGPLQGPEKERIWLQ
jgi:phosphoribosylformylglycinamidine cyclo-ligase